jgi:hypothetical protein
MDGSPSAQFRLDWSSISGTQSNFFDAICLLELLQNGLNKEDIPLGEGETLMDRQKLHFPSEI